MTEVGYDIGDDELDVEGDFDGESEFGFDLVDVGAAPRTDLENIEFKVEPDAWVPVEDLMKKFHPFNSQTRWEHEKDAIVRSIADYGFSGELIIVNPWNDKIVGGHGRVEVCWERGYRGKLPVIYLTLESEPEHRRAMLRFNKARGHQDIEKERQEIQTLLEIFDASAVQKDMAMMDSEMADLLKLVDDAEKEAPESFDEYDENIDTEYCCPKCNYTWSGKPK